MAEAGLLEKLRKIEALHAGATRGGASGRQAYPSSTRGSAGPRAGHRDGPYAARSLDAKAVRRALPPPLWLAAFRRPRQRASTVQVLAPATFQETTLWPELDALATELTKHLAEVTDRVIHEGVHADTSEAAEAEALKALGQGATSE